MYAMAHPVQFVVLTAEEERTLARKWLDHGDEKAHTRLMGLLPNIHFGHFFPNTAG